MLPRLMNSAIVHDDKAHFKLPKEKPRLKSETGFST